MITKSTALSECQCWCNSVAISTLKAGDRERMIFELGATDVQEEVVLEASTKVVRGYKWRRANEDADEQRNLCKTFLQKHLDVATVTVTDITGKRDLLSSSDERLPLRLTGTADFLIEGPSHPSEQTQVVVELKKRVQGSHASQALAQLLSAHFQPAKKTVSLLTDLNNTWNFSRVSHDGSSYTIHLVCHGSYLLTLLQRKFV